MTRKLIAMLLCVMMVASIITVPAFADEAPNYEDYDAPTDLPPNLYVNDKGLTGRWMATFGTIHPTHTGGVEGAMRYPIETAPQYWGDTSTSVVVGGDMTESIGGYKWKANTNYVIQTDLMNSPDSDVQGRFGYMINAKDSDGNVSKDAKILDVTSNTEWQTFKFVLHSGYAGEATNMLNYGYPNHSSFQNPQGTEIRHRIGSFYIAEEVVYGVDITGVTTTCPGGSMKLTASLVNQLGLNMSSEDGFSWLALDKDRTAEVSGFDFASGENGEVTVTVDKDVECGKYVILAIHEGEDSVAKGIQKGIEINVVNYPDYMPSDNSVSNIMEISTGLGRNASDVDTSDSGTNHTYTISSSSGSQTSSYAANAGDNIKGVTSSLESGKTYIASFKAKNAAPTVVAAPKFGFSYYHDGLTNQRVDAEISSTDWQKVTGYITIPSVSGSNKVLALGFREEASYSTNYIKTIVGAKVTIDTESLYLAEETSCDITVSAASDKVAPGGTLTVNAQLKNQLGETGNLLQDFTWKIVSADRIDEITEKITIAAGEDGAATVTVDSDATPGTYVAYAVSSENPSIAKGVEFEVSATADYVRGEKPANIMPNNANASNFTGRWLGIYDAIHDSTNKLMRYPIVSSPGYWGDTSHWQVAGGDLTDQDAAGSDTGIGNGNYTWKANTNYVISVDLRNAPGAAVQNSRFGFQFAATDAQGNVCRPYRLLDVAGSEWQTHTFVLHCDYAGDASTRLYYGYPNHSSLHNPQGTEIQLRLGSFYIAEEAAYDITNEVVGESNKVAPGESIGVKATVLNQIEIEGNLNQNFTWKAYDKDRVNEIEGITIAEGENGAATVNVASTVAEGTYVILAGSEDYAGFRKGVEIQVVPAEEVTLITLDESVEGKVTLAAAKVENTAATEVMFVVASYNTTTKKMIEAKKAVATVADGEAVLAEEVTIGVVGADSVRVFVWDTEGYRPIALADGVVATK